MAPSPVRDELQLQRGAASPPTRCSSTSSSAGRSRRQMDLTACFLPKPVTGVNGNGMHTNLSRGAQGRRTCSTTKGGRTACPDRAGTSSSRILTNAHDICLVAQPERQRLPPPRSRTSRPPTRSRPAPSTAARWCASPTATSARPASRCARSRRTPTRTWRSTRLLRTGLEGPLSQEDESQAAAAPASCRTTSTTPSAVQGPSSCMEALGEEVHAKFAELKRLPGRALPQGAGHPGQGLRGAVPPRGHQPVPLEPVLEAPPRKTVLPPAVRQGQGGTCPGGPLAHEPRAVCWKP